MESDSILSRILTWPLRRPIVVSLTAAVLFVIAAWMILRLKPDGSLSAMFSPDNPAAAALTRVLDDFAGVDELLVVASIPDGRPSRNDDISQLKQFADRLCADLPTDPATAALIEGAYDRPDPQTRAYFEKVLLPAAMYYLDDAPFAAARERLTLPAMREQLKQDEAMMTAPGAASGLAKALMKDPLRLREFIAPVASRLESVRPMQSRTGEEAFVSPDGRSIIVRVRGKRPPSDLDFCKNLVAATTSVADRVNGGKFQMGYAGAYAIAAASATAIKSDMTSSVTGSVILLQILFLFAYRAPFRLFAMAFGPIALGLIMGFGGYSLFTTTLTPLTAVLGGILAGMAIDYSIQYLSMYEAQRDAGQTPLKSAAASAVGITPAAFGAWATSIVGFLAIGASPVKSLHDFALLGTLGLTGAFVAKMALLPMLLWLTDRRGDGRPATSMFRFSLAPVLRWISRRPRFWIAASGIIFVAGVAILAIAPGPLLPMESDLTVMHPRPNAALDAQKFIAEHFGFRDFLIVYLKADSADSLIALSSRVESRLNSPTAKSAGVSASYGLATLLPDASVVAARKSIQNPAEKEHVISDFHQAIADSPFNPEAAEIRDYAKGLDAILSASPPTINDIQAYPRVAEFLLPLSQTRAKNATEAITLVFLAGSTDNRTARDSAVDGVRGLLSDEPGATLTGVSVLSYDSERHVRHDLPRLCLLALAIVLAYLVIHFRNLTEAALTLAPTVFSLVTLLAAMRVVGQKLNMINLVAAPLLIGIDVDYGIFLVAIARLAIVRREPKETLIARIAPVCHAVAICGAATFVGYASLMWTSVPAIRSLGFAVAVGIAACLFSVLLSVAPILMLNCNNESDEPAGSPER